MIDDESTHDIQPTGPDEVATSSVGGPQAAIVTFNPGDRIAGFTIVDFIGVGGMGAVYRATQAAPSREVALKIIRAGALSPQLLRRFEFEVEILGRLQHPGIAQIYEAGANPTEQGIQPYFAMELVEGRNLRTWCQRHEATTRQRLQLVAQICDAVDHAHQKGVIHRDLKPGNILVTNDGKPKVLDFGVARATDSDQQATIQTNVGQLVGTIPYMSPEQVSGDPRDLDVRSDVYALGVILFELLTGRLPYSLTDLSVYEAVRIIRDETPTRMTTLDAALRGDIETIVSKALEKERDRRYQSAAALADDIRRHLDDVPILARPATTLYKFTKFARRNRIPVALAATLVVALIAGSITSIKFGIDAVEEREVARAEREVSQDALAFQSRMLKGVEPHAMGKGIIRDLREQVARQHRRGSERSQAMAELDRLLIDVNAADLARGVVDRSILTPAVKALESEYADQPLVEAPLRESIAEVYYNLGINGRAVTEIRSAADIYAAQLGPEDPKTIEALTFTAFALQLDNRDDEAREVINAIVPSIDDAIASGESHLIAAALMGASGQLSTQGDHAENIRLVETIRSMIADGLEVTPEVHLFCLTRLAVAYFLAGELDRAADVGNEAAALAIATYGRSHWKTQIVRTLQGETLKLSDRNEEALEVTTEVLALRRELLGNRHPDTLIAITNHASVLSRLGRYEEAIDLYEEDIATTTEILGANHGTLAPTYANLGRAHIEQGEYQLALEVLNKALGLATRSLDLRGIGVILQARGDTYLNLDRPADAIADLERSRSIMLQVYAPEHPHHKATAERLVRACEAIGDSENAAKWRALSER